MGVGGSKGRLFTLRHSIFDSFISILFAPFFCGFLTVDNAVDRVDRSGEFEKKKTKQNTNCNFSIVRDLALRWRANRVAIQADRCLVSHEIRVSLSMEKERPTLWFEITTERPNSNRRFPSAIGDAYL